MDDGLQHLTLHRDLSLLCIDAADQLGNGRLLPAGPMREPLPRALARVDAVVAVTSAGAEHAPSASALRTALELPRSMPLLRAIIEPTPQSAATLRDARLVAFSATAHPRRFFASLRALGCSFATPPLALPDHAPIAPATLQALRRDADAHGARLATTRKDHVRMAPEQRGGVEVLDVTVRWLDGADVALDALVRPLLAKVLARAG